MVWVESTILQHRGDVPGYPLILYKVELKTLKGLTPYAYVCQVWTGSTWIHTIYPRD